MVSMSEMGRLSVSEPGLGMGMRLVCLAFVGSILCISISSASVCIRVVQIGGRRARTLSVKPSCRALLGIACIVFVIIIGQLG